MKRLRKAAARTNPSEALNEAVESMMSDREVSAAPIQPRLAGLLSVAADLRGLPRPDFKTRLMRALISGARPARKSTRAKTKPAAGHQTATACLIVRDGARAIEFYQRAFGATELMRHADPSGRIAHAEIAIGDSRIALAEEYGEHNLSPQALGGASAIVQLEVENVDAFAARAVAAGAKIVFPVADQFYGERGGRLADPFGHLWIVSTHIEDVPAREMKRRFQEWTRQQAAEPPKPALTAGAALPSGAHSLTACLQVEGATALIDFLKQAFGARELIKVTGDDGRIVHGEVRIEGSIVNVADATDRYPANRAALWLHLKDVDAVYERALRAGADSIHPPEDQEYGERSASVADPSGNYWYIATPLPGAEPSRPELRSVTAFLHPRGTPAVIDFLRRAFDGEELFRAEDDAGVVHHSEVKLGDSIVAMGEAHGPYQPMPPVLRLFVRDTDLAYRRALSAGALAMNPPADQPWGQRSAAVKDPFGGVWYLAASARAEAGAIAAPARSPIMPFVYVDDTLKEAEFCKQVFGAAEIHRETQANGRVSHLQLAIGPTRVMLRDANTDDLADYRKRGLAATPRALGASPLHLYIYVDDADAAFKRALELGARVADSVEDQPWGDRCGGVQDPAGHVWYIATPLKPARTSGEGE